VLDDRGIARTDVIGHSYGGAVSQRGSRAQSLRSSSAPGTCYCGTSPSA